MMINIRNWLVKSPNFLLLLLSKKSKINLVLNLNEIAKGSRSGKDQFFPIATLVLVETISDRS